mmetsp:Transcript_14098/g.23402  ORF Transcript_14098/g.23402 Transcript_14098/m.23402 type:complete len:269 (+) Transcript_14098:65-871(+)|eukprot:CAMPEP_0119313060 /NCGR_PEP_ID=MMETSP1333-20130426/27731_1 /TAXON_ID=418940 /ORGANISM="Scyphosphaera apsteinii, Strain RCC1455" /LENGTH=268 /DNA_ID=CAMNT_0007317793 /DNA_START=65 /DNA_END=871 /DNA_ORIENTATION=+
MVLFVGVASVAMTVIRINSVQITSQAILSIAVGNALPQPLTVGLYGTLAPQSVALFEGLCDGTLGTDLKYAGSFVSRIEQNKLILGGSLAGGSTLAISREIDKTGYVRSEIVNRAADFWNDDANTLSHDRAGLLSMRKGGGSFEFGLTPAANPALDATRIVIGEVLADENGDNLRLIAALNDLPTRQPSAMSELGGLVSLYGLRLGLGFGFGGLIGQSLQLSRRDALLATALGAAGASFIGSDPRDTPDLTYRPLTKVRILSAVVRKL